MLLSGLKLLAIVFKCKSAPAVLELDDAKDKL
jgi:hypothetical protein